MEKLHCTKLLFRVNKFFLSKKFEYKKLIGQLIIIIFHLDDKIEFIELLLQHGADIDAVTTDQNTALHIATSLVYDKSVRFLLKRGANRKIENDDEKTALDIAKENESGGKIQRCIINWLEMCYKI